MDMHPFSVSGSEVCYKVQKLANLTRLLPSTTSAFQVPDLEAATALYRDVMGASVSEQQVNWPYARVDWLGPGKTIFSIGCAARTYTAFVIE